MRGQQHWITRVAHRRELRRFVWSVAAGLSCLLFSFPRCRIFLIPSRAFFWSITSSFFAIPDHCEPGAMAEPGAPRSRTMHPAPSLGEAPPVEFPRPRLAYDLQALISDVQSPATGNGNTGFEGQEPERLSTPGPDEPGHLLSRPDSIATASDRLERHRIPSVEATTTTPSTIIPLQAMLNRQTEFAVQDRPDQPDQPDESRTLKGARRRTGPLNQEQRVKAAIIRKIGACQDCRRRRVSCDPARTPHFLWSPFLLTFLPLPL